MAGGRPTDYDSIVDHSTVTVGNCGPTAARKKWDGPRETVWTAELMADYDKWGSLVGLPAAVRVDLEKHLTPPYAEGRGVSLRALGVPRADAIIWHSDASLSIVEAKVTSSPSEVCGGVGQLIYYKTLIEAYWGAEVIGMILACPFLPPLVLESIANVRAPIRFLKADGLEFNGLVANYGDA